LEPAAANIGVIQFVPMSVSQFYASVMDARSALLIPVSIYPKPAEVENAGREHFQDVTLR